ncbi:hypothetical protein QL992_14190 [Microbacterium sp. APC 3898]|uniref:Uncharacterized protein n=1 Tax=Planococcus notacanthi TaxID=3035188 RepID=A0ABT7ZHT0_9BACL|nr:MULTISPECIES: hypothetical protein [Terrabacteria group]MDN3426671.1 hypothetical protein [Planococcus sp. APC 4016]MDN3500365.1 hypothetical protein [Microbacterium sp. APC 3898]
MKKGWLSIVIGLVLGLTLSYFLLSYNGWTMVSIGNDGETLSSVNELDFDLITNAFGLVLLCIAVVYGTLSVFNKRS